MLKRDLEEKNGKDLGFRPGELQSTSELLEEKKKKGFVYTSKSQLEAIANAELKWI